MNNITVSNKEDYIKKIESILEYEKKFDILDDYLDFYKDGKRMLFALKSRKTFDSTFFQKLNDYITSFCCGIEEIYLSDEIISDYLTFATDFCYHFGYDVEPAVIHFDESSLFEF